MAQDAQPFTYMIWQPHSRDPWLYWLGPADAHALMCTADTLSTTSPTDAAPTANVGSGTETTGKSLTTTAYLDHIYSIVCDDFSGTQAQNWAGPADSDLVFSANRTWGGQAECFAMLHSGTTAETSGRHRNRSRNLEYER